MVACGRSRIACPVECQPHCNKDCCKILRSKSVESQKRTITSLDDPFKDDDDDIVSRDDFNTDDDHDDNWRHDEMW